LIFIGFCFSLSSFFPCWALDFLLVITMHHDLASPFGMYQSYLIHTLNIKVSTRFHQLSKTKLGLSLSIFAKKNLNLSILILFLKLQNWISYPLNSQNH
jgi:hypothetical protein